MKIKRNLFVIGFIAIALFAIVFLANVSNSAATSDNSTNVIEEQTSTITEQKAPRSTHVTMPDTWLQTTAIGIDHSIITEILFVNS